MPELVREAVIRGAIPLLPLLVAACAEVEAPSTPAVLLDGLFDEWTGAATLIDDPPDAPDAAVDLLSVQAMDDPQWLYLALDVGNEVSLQALPGTLHLFLDTDADRGTGLSRAGMDGVDLVVDLAYSSMPRASGDRSVGFGVRAADDRGRFQVVDRHGLGLMAAPTWSAPRFEVRLARRGPAGTTFPGRDVRLKAVYEERSTVLDETAVGSYRFGTSAATDAGTPRPETVARRMERPPGSVRVAAWNVAGGVSRRPEDFARVLASLDPDVLLLDELAPDLSNESLTAFLSTGALGDLGPWSAVLGEPAIGQKAAVAARGRAIVPASALRDAPYPAEARATLPEIFGGPQLIDYLLRAGEPHLPATGGWVELGGTRALFVVVDLTATGWVGSPHDRIRLIEAAAIHERLAALLTEEPGPVIVGGDLNLVGSRAPLFQLVRRLDVDGSDLVPVDAERLGERSLATWRDPQMPFAPGRLDFLLVPDAAVTVANSFVFAIEDLDDETLAGLGLGRDLMEGLSDHLVVVADLLFPSPVTR